MVEICAATGEKMMLDEDDVACPSWCLASAISMRTCEEEIGSSCACCFSSLSALAAAF